jgi:chromate reductase
MSEPLRILGISGSLRARSYNTALLAAAAEVMAPTMGLVRGRIDDLPLYNRDVEVQGLPEPVQRLRTQAADADAVLFACPEYNRSITGALKNAVDWLSRNPASPIDHQPAAIIGGGGRAGAARAQSHLRDVLAHNRVQVYEESEVVVPRVWDSFDDDLQLRNDQVWTDLRTLCAGFEADVRRDLAHRPAVVAVGPTPAALADPYRALIADYRVATAFDPASLAAAQERWSPVAVVVAGDAVVDASGLPIVVAGEDPEDLRDRVAQAIS